MSQVKYMQFIMNPTNTTSSMKAMRHQGESTTDVAIFTPRRMTLMGKFQI